MCPGQDLRLPRALVIHRHPWALRSSHTAQMGLQSGCGVGSSQGGAPNICEGLSDRALGIEVLNNWENQTPGEDPWGCSGAMLVDLCVYANACHSVGSHPTRFVPFAGP